MTHVLAITGAVCLIWIGVGLAWVGISSIQLWYRVAPRFRHWSDLWLGVGAILLAITELIFTLYVLGKAIEAI